MLYIGICTCQHSVCSLSVFANVVTLSGSFSAGGICPGMENSDYNNVMGIMKMSMQSTLWCDRSTPLRCLAWDMGEFASISPRPIQQHAGFARNCEQKKEEASLFMEKVTPVYRVNSRTSMALSTSMDPFLNTSE